MGPLGLLTSLSEELELGTPASKSCTHPLIVTLTTCFRIWTRHGPPNPATCHCMSVHCTGKLQIEDSATAGHHKVVWLGWVAVVPLVDDDGQRAQLRGGHALLTAPQQAVPQPPRQAPYAVPPPAAPTTRLPSVFASSKRSRICTPERVNSCMRPCSSGVRQCDEGHRDRKGCTILRW